MTKGKFAGAISAIFDPLVEGPIILVILFWKGEPVSCWLLPVIFGLTVVVPVGFLLYNLKRGWIDDWEMTDRHQRHRFHLLCLLMLFFSLILLYFWGDSFLRRWFLIFAILVFLYSLITFFWKISGHMTANTAFVLVLNLLFGWRFWWLFLILPLVAWSRLARNKHNIWQILAGVALSGLIVLLGDYVFF